MSYQLSAETIHELEQKLAELKLKNNWKERPELPKIKKVLEVLHKFVDPKAFIGGGCALSLKLGRPIADVDVYFTTPFNYQPGVFLERIFKANSSGEVKSCRNDYENNLICNLVAEGTFEGIKYQFMWVNVSTGFDADKFEKTVLKSFDINLCRIGLNIYREALLIETEEHKSDLNNKTLTISSGLKAVQLAKTINVRMPKYREKFPEFRQSPLPVEYVPTSETLAPVMDFFGKLIIE